MADTFDIRRQGLEKRLEVEVNICQDVLIWELKEATIGQSQNQFVYF